jgi:hypothetical protein
MVQNQMLDPASAATKISAVQKELRSHIQAVRSIADGLDRRGLILAGADRTIRELINTLDGQPGLQQLVDEAAVLVWSTIELEEKA